jgi:hypothetical protein
MPSKGRGGFAAAAVYTRLKVRWLEIWAASGCRASLAMPSKGRGGFAAAAVYTRLKVRWLENVGPPSSQLALAS